MNFAQIKREIQDDTLDPDKFVKMTHELEKYNQKLTRIRKTI